MGCVQSRLVLPSKEESAATAKEQRTTIKQQAHIASLSQLNTRDYQQCANIYKHWADPTILRGEFEEYRRQIVVVSSLMSRSKLSMQLEALQPRLHQASFEDIVVKAIQRGYPDEALCHQCRRMPPSQRLAVCPNCNALAAMVQCKIDDRYLYHNIITTFNNLGWRQRYLSVALEVLSRLEDPATLQAHTLMLLARAGEECESRRVMAFNTVVSQSIKFLSADPVNIISNRNSLPPGHLVQLPEDVELYFAEDSTPITSVHAFFEEWLDSYKSKAFKSAVLEPTRLYFHLAGNPVARDDVEVHYSNTYSAILLATLGVALPTPPFLEEGCIPPTIFAAKSLGTCYAEMLKSDNFGKDWTTIRACRNATIGGADRYIANLEGSSAKEVANNLLAPQRTPTSPERAISQRFAHFFTAEVFLEAAANALVRDGPEAALRRVLDAMVALGRTQAVGEGGSVGDWLFDADNRYCCRLQNVRAMLLFLGLVNPA